jgi:hypothetical protein
MNDPAALRRRRETTLQTFGGGPRGEASAQNRSAGAATSWKTERANAGKGRAIEMPAGGIPRFATCSEQYGQCSKRCSIECAGRRSMSSALPSPEFHVALGEVHICPKTVSPGFWSATEMVGATAPSRTARLAAHRKKVRCSRRNRIAEL